MRRILIALLAASAPAMLPAQTLTNADLRAPATPFTETQFGDRVDDPYRWMEQSGPELDTWAKAEAINARSVLLSIPNRDAIRARIASLDTLDCLQACLVLACVLW